MFSVLEIESSRVRRVLKNLRSEKEPDIEPTDRRCCPKS